ncbi:MAG: hypothetical protein ACI97P_002065, partial [Arcticibacterium sp.]
MTISFLTIESLIITSFHPFHHQADHVPSQAFLQEYQK